MVSSNTVTNIANYQKKRLIVFSDGTWSTPEVPKPSNIVRLAKAVRTASSDGTCQVLMYDRGIGTSGGADRLMGGAFGAGIDQNIEELYSFLATNYSDGDEIYMFGYSRGAYTVRSLAGMINKCGLVRRASLDFIKQAYDLYREKVDTEEKEQEIRIFRETHGDRVPIELVVCYDTVGSLGIPESVGWLNGLTRAKYEFHDTKLSEIIKNAIHMLAIDEERSTFKPTVMTQHENVKNQLTQKYFWGSHGGVGGGEVTEGEVGDISLCFTIDEILRRNLGLEFDMDVIPSYPSVNVDRRITAGKSGFMSFLNFFTGRHVRPIEKIEDVHETAVERYRSVSSWRPDALKPVAKDIENDN